VNYREVKCLRLESATIDINITGLKNM